MRYQLNICIICALLGFLCKILKRNSTYKHATILKIECIPVGFVPPALYTIRDRGPPPPTETLPDRDSPLNRDALDRDPQTEIPLYRNYPGQSPHPPDRDPPPLIILCACYILSSYLPYFDLYLKAMPLHILTKSEI